MEPVLNLQKLNPIEKAQRDLIKIKWMNQALVAIDRHLEKLMQQGPSKFEELQDISERVLSPYDFKYVGTYSQDFVPKSPSYSPDSPSYIPDPEPEEEEETNIDG